MEVFEAIDRLHKGDPLSDDLPSDFVLHRYFVSNPTLAQVAKEFQLTIRDRKLMYGCWQAFIQPQATPFFTYIGPKKPKSHKLKERIIEVEGLSESEVDFLLKLADESEFHSYYGVEIGS